MNIIKVSKFTVNQKNKYFFKVFNLFFSLSHSSNTNSKEYIKRVGDKKLNPYERIETWAKTKMKEEIFSEYFFLCLLTHRSLLSSRFFTSMGRCFAHVSIFDTYIPFIRLTTLQKISLSLTRTWSLSSVYWAVKFRSLTQWIFFTSILQKIFIYNSFLIKENFIRYLYTN